MSDPFAGTPTVFGFAPGQHGFVSMQSLEGHAQPLRPLPPCRSATHPKSILTLALALPPGVERSRLCLPDAFLEEDCWSSDDDDEEDSQDDAGYEEDDEMLGSEESDSFSLWEAPPTPSSQPIDIPASRRRPHYKLRAVQQRPPSYHQPQQPHQQDQHPHQQHHGPSAPQLR